MRQVIGQFKAIDKDKLIILVDVIQECSVDDNRLVIDHRKIFRVNDGDGEELIPTNDPEIFLRGNGSRLLKEGPIKTRGV